MDRIKKYVITMAVILIFFGNAYGANVSFDITNNYLPGDTNITFDFSCTTDTEVEVRLYEFDFKYDPNELAFISHENLGQSVFSPDYSLSVVTDVFTNDPIGGYLTEFIVKQNRGAQVETLTAGTTKLGSFTFSLKMDTVLDGVSDFNMDSAVNIFMREVGATSYLPKESLSMGGALNYMADVGGSPVPVPSAVWLMGSGLLGLCGFRRRYA